MTKIAIFGVGLIGGSLALCFKGKQDFYVVGHSNNPKSVERYINSGVVDHATTSMEEAVRDADFIFLGVPVGNLEEYLIKLQQLPLKPGCIISDAGSTKGSIVQSASKLDFGAAYFIGGHPMAGKETTGVESASLHLFENAIYVLTPTESTPEPVYDKLVELLRWTKAYIIKVDAKLHDNIVGATSHLPHIVAVALVNQVSGYNDENPLYRDLMAGGFRDTTRIASGDPIIWRDILLDNREVILGLLQDWNRGIDRFITLLSSGDGEGVAEQFRTAGQFRSELPERRKGIITTPYEIYVDVPDHPGIIGQIASLLGHNRINLSNIHIFESREQVPGVLRLSFREERDKDNAEELLKQNNYSVHV
jgi:prephenate dehydrogenase